MRFHSLPMKSILLALTAAMGLHPAMAEEPDAAMLEPSADETPLLSQEEPESDWKADGSSPLHIAAWSGDVELCRKLIAEGADVNQLNDAGYSPLACALLPSNAEVCRVLAEAGASFAFPMALYYAVGTGDVGLVTKALEAGADVNEQFDIECFRETQTALKYAISSGNIDICRMLLAAGAEPTNSELRTAVSYNNIEACRLLLQWGCEPPDYEVYRPMHEAAENLNKEMFSLLLAAGGNINEPDYWGKRPLWILCRDEPEYREMFRWVLSMGPDLNCQRDGGQTLLHCVVDDPELCRWLLEAGADPSIKDDDGLTAAQYARAHGATEAAELIENFPVRDSLIRKAVENTDYLESCYSDFVVYDPARDMLCVSNKEFAATRLSPLFTFMLTAGAILMEADVLTPDGSIHENYKLFPKAMWPDEKAEYRVWADSVEQANNFRTSLQFYKTWYFHKLMSTLPHTILEDGLRRLGFGNADVSDWYGSVDLGRHDIRERGFWNNASLRISPLEYVQVLEKIFGPNSEFSDGVVEGLLLSMNAVRLDDKDGSMVRVIFGAGKRMILCVGVCSTGQGDDARNIYFCYRFSDYDENVEQILNEILSKKDSSSLYFTPEYMRSHITSMLEKFLRDSDESLRAKSALNQ